MDTGIGIAMKVTSIIALSIDPYINDFSRKGITFLGKFVDNTVEHKDLDFVISRMIKENNKPSIIFSFNKETHFTASFYIEWLGVEDITLTKHFDSINDFTVESLEEMFVIILKKLSSPSYKINHTVKTHEYFSNNFLLCGNYIVE